MQSKSDNIMEFLMTYGWAILIMLIAISVLTYFGVFDKFNPDEDICLNYKNLSYESCLNGVRISFGMVSYICKKEVPSDECAEWRQKTFCEECIECFEGNPHCTSWSDECEAKCVCDEYSIFNIAEYQCGFKEQVVEDTPDLMRRYNCHIPVYRKGSCIKVHEKTIKNLTCEELKEYYLNGNPQIECEGFLCVNFNFKYPSANDKEIILEYINRCGGD